MSAFFEHLIGLASAHAGLAYLMIFLAALLEAVPVLGSVIPGSTIILALSALIPGGQLNVVLVLAVAVAGAVIGDGGAYWIGHREQRRILGVWPMSRYPLLVARSEAFFLRYGAWAVFFARFVAPVRAFVPITAGALRMPPVRFFAVNIPAILLWAPAHVLPGVIAATVLEKPGALGPHHLLPVLGGAVATVLLALWAFRRWRNAPAELHASG
ncbi:MAG: DedA family protein [Rhodopseudomonas sp.]|uniref:DedA family protein n=1 Tax=Rhodopseudomonas sp. TaxID=1078 RepID=UPI0017D8A419|nr:DedA family protein [Rhodopseudomonas sp.]NVN85773.1 DedA family protein [Rhodopseudomonas sp.]